MTYHNPIQACIMVNCALMFSVPNKFVLVSNAFRRTLIYLENLLIHDTTIGAFWTTHIASRKSRSGFTKNLHPSHHHKSIYRRENDIQSSTSSYTTQSWAFPCIRLIEKELRIYGCWDLPDIFLWEELLRNWRVRLATFRTWVQSW